MAESGTDPIEQQLRSAFPGGAIARVQVLTYGDDPGVEPGQTVALVLLDRAGRPEGKDADKQIMDAFAKANHDTLRKLREDLPRSLARVEFRADGATAGGPKLWLGGPGRPGAADEGTEDFTPVMTRLGPADLATVDTLIAAGIAQSRAEALRWALGRIREHPVYGELQQRVREIDELKSQF
jgi:hypothetical protein